MYGTREKPKRIFILKFVDALLLLSIALFEKHSFRGSFLVVFCHRSASVMSLWHLSGTLTRLLSHQLQHLLISWISTLERSVPLSRKDYSMRVYGHDCRVDGAGLQFPPIPLAFHGSLWKCEMACWRRAIYLSLDDWWVSGAQSHSSCSANMILSSMPPHKINSQCRGPSKFCQTQKAFL